MVSFVEKASHQNSEAMTVKKIIEGMKNRGTVVHPLSLASLPTSFGRGSPRGYEHRASGHSPRPP